MPPVQYPDHGYNARIMNPPADSQAWSAQGSSKRLGQLAAVLLTLILSGLVDMATGFEVSVFLVYTIPVALATRWIGVAAGLATALLATAVWVWADQASGHLYSQPWILYVNAANRMFCFLLTVKAIRYVRARQDVLRKRLSAFSGAVPHCTQCHRLGDEGGYWRTPEAYLAEFGGATPLNKVCPDCARRTYARAAYRNDAEQAR
jgi:hypothetical protein